VGGDKVNGEQGAEGQRGGGAEGQRSKRRIIMPNDGSCSTWGNPIALSVSPWEETALPPQCPMPTRTAFTEFQP